MAGLSNRISTLVPQGGDGWEIHYRATKIRAAGRPVTFLSVGDHDVATSVPILDAMKVSMDAGHLGYTSVPGTLALRRAVADRIAWRTGVPAGPENVLVTTGGQGALFASMMAALDPGDGCVVLDPYYASFCVTVRAASGKPVVVRTRPPASFSDQHHHRIFEIAADGVEELGPKRAVNDAMVDRKRN